MRFTVRLKIAAAMAVALAIAVVVGIVGLNGVHTTYGLADGMYRTNVLAIVDVGEARTAITDARLALNRGLVDPSRRDIGKMMQQDEARLDAAWHRYYPGLVSSDEERAAAHDFDSVWAAAGPKANEEAALLDAGKTDRARQMHLSEVAADMSAATVAIDKLVAINQKQSADAAAQAAQHYVGTWRLELAILLVGVIALLAATILLVRAIVQPLAQARELAGAIQSGRLNNRTAIVGNDEFSDTLHSLEDMDRQLTSIVTEVRTISEQVTSAARDLSQGSDDLSQRTQEQASSLEETAASMEEITATVKQNADGAYQARDMAARMRKSAEQGLEIADSAVHAMQAISKASGEISEIVSLIDEIAFQTNLLALNAAVEAARAGEQGRGFAVVATEVRNLAQRSGTAAKSIKALIQDTVHKVAEGAGLVQRTGGALGEIAAEVREVNTIIEVIAAASEEQSTGVGQINNALLTLDEVTQQNAALVEESSAASRNTLDLSQALLTQVSYFSVQGNAAAPAAPKAPAPAPPVARKPTEKLSMRVPEPALALAGDDWSDF